MEQDWTLPGNVIPPFPLDDGAREEVCPFEHGGFAEEIFVVKYLKGGGPGNFLDTGDFHNLGALPDLILDLISVDEANVFVHSFDCTSRIVFESEQPGQVDVEAYVIDHLGCEVFGNDDLRDIDDFCIADGIGFYFEPNQTKVAFVIYYMKFEDVKVGLVTSVSKPTHNSSVTQNLDGYLQYVNTTAAGWADYSPGNPWDASTDVTSTSWNVSKDLLVRGRVRGWFLNENPSGRARDDSDPLNVKPADRWIMPTDWPLLAGGPADPADGSDATGTAEQFRPYYDLMIAPNNVRNLALATPDGRPTNIVVSQVVAWPAGGIAPAASASATTFAIAPTSELFTGSPLTFPVPGVRVGAGTCNTAPALTEVLSTGPITNSSGNVVGQYVTLGDVAGTLIVGVPLCSTPAAGTAVTLVSNPFVGPLSLV
ncbi:MAG: hypothetical protein KDB69_02010, partial [Acidimicrobiia bacterium]|nr:hypothetical protein [Acidimicrobiia bacterium]